jgi:hypothetical protein
LTFIIGKTAWRKKEKDALARYRNVPFYRGYRIRTCKTLLPKNNSFHFYPTKETILTSLIHTKVDTEIRTMIKNGCKMIQVCSSIDVINNKEIVEVFIKYFGTR